MNNKTALILGVTGQDGSYLADILISKGYIVHGMYRKSATGNTKNILHLINNPNIFNVKFFLHKGDLLDASSLFRLISTIHPDEIYNEADQDHVRWSYEIPYYSSLVTGSAVVTILEIIKQVDTNIRYFQPCTSNMFGLTDDKLLDENSKFNPLSPYAISKTFAYYTVKFYRQAYNMHVSNAILFNHESPRRTMEYVSRKISNTVARIFLGKSDSLILGDVNAVIDWGYAPEYMEAAWLMLQQDEANDFVIGSGVGHTVQDFVNEAFSYLNLDPNKYVTTSDEFIRPTKTSTLIADTTKAKQILNFDLKTSFKDLVIQMVDNDILIESKNDN